MNYIELKIIKTLAHENEILPASFIAFKVLKFARENIRPQGAALAVSKYLHTLEKKGFIKSCKTGWYLTTKAQAVYCTSIVARNSEGHIVGKIQN